MNWQNMPDHIYLRVFQYLNWEDILNSSQVCYEWSRAVRRSKSWITNTEFAITQYRGFKHFAVVDPKTVFNLSSKHQNVVVRGFIVDEWCDHKFKQMNRAFSIMVHRCHIRGFTLKVPVGSKFLREFLLVNEQLLHDIEDFTLYVQDKFCDSHTYNFIVNFASLRRIRILQSPMVDLTSRQTIQVNSTHLEEISLCSNSSLGVIFNNPKAKLKRLCIFAHSYRTQMIQEVIAINEFILNTLVIECSSVIPWIEYTIGHLIPVLGPARLEINQREELTLAEMHNIAQLFKEADENLTELVIRIKKDEFCDCGYVL